MKRIGKLYVCLAVLLISASSMKVFAGGESKPVQGKTVFHMAEHVYEDEIQKEKGSIITETGTEIVIEGEKLDGYTLRVMELFEGDEAFTWLKKETENRGILREAYDVLIEDEKGNFVTPGREFSITIYSEENAEDLKAFHVDVQGNMEELEQDEVKGKRSEDITIHGTELDYYILLKDFENSGNNEEGNAPNGSISSQEGNTGGSGSTDKVSLNQVKTGDSNEIEMSLFIAALSVLAGVLCFRKLRRDGW